MVQSINHKADFVTKATSFQGFDEYGQLMVGDVGLEFYSDRNVQKFIQIPWNEVDVVLASVLFKGKWIPRIGIRTKKDGTFMFAAKEPKKLLHYIGEYIPHDRMYRSWTLWDVTKKNFERLKNRHPKSQ
ncbi:MAG: DUF956 family protein [Allobaculum sp.]|nr:DUF956 family protein [Allobaculum sp.]MDE5758291.1 DUF956 family protein [Allobaculum sp.]